MWHRYLKKSLRHKHFGLKSIVPTFKNKINV